MTTTSTLVEIIDLTDTPPSIDNETQKLPKYTDDGIDADSERGAARAVRKPKSGETSRTRGYPAGSRGGSLERGHIQSGEGIEYQLVEDAQGGSGASTKKKKRRSKKNKDKDKDSIPPLREDTQNEALSTLDDRELFFVDTVPASVPVGTAFDSAGIAKDPQSPSKASEDKVPLLLPAHVSVLDPDFPMQIIQPADPDSDLESYIEYLDYDDRMVRSPQQPCAVMNSSLISRRHLTWYAILRFLWRRKSRRALSANDAGYSTNTSPTNAL